MTFQVPASPFVVGLSPGLSAGLSPGLSSIRAKPDRARVPASSTPPSRAHVRRSMSGSFQGREAGMAQDAFPSVYRASTRTQATRTDRYTAARRLFIVALTDATTGRLELRRQESGRTRTVPARRPLAAESPVTNGLHCARTHTTSFRWNPHLPASEPPGGTFQPRRGYSSSEGEFTCVDG